MTVRPLLGLVARAVCTWLLILPESVHADDAYEEPPTLDVSDILPESTLESPYYYFEPTVPTDGYTNVYSIVSDFGVFRADGTELALERVREIRALVAISELKKTESYADGMKQAAQDTVESGKRVISHPMQTAREVPKGVARLFGNLARMAQGGRGEYEDSAAKEIIGFSATKRTLAYELGVDPYTSNETLQKALNDLTWVTYAGGLSVEAVKQLVPPDPVPQHLFAVETTVSMGEMLRDNSPESLERINEEKLKAIDPEGVLTRRLIENPWYSARRETLLAEALHGLREVEFIRHYLHLSVGAQSEEEALFFHRTAELLRAYHDTVRPVRALYIDLGLPVAYTADGGLVLTLAIDTLAWTEETAGVMRALPDAVPSDRPLYRKELWVTGSLTDRARSELNGMGYETHEKAAAALDAPPRS